VYWIPFVRLVKVIGEPMVEVAVRFPGVDEAKYRVTVEPPLEPGVKEIMT